MARDKSEFLRGKPGLAAAICLASSLVFTGSLPAMANGATVTEIDVVWPGFDPVLASGQEKTPTGEVEITVKVSGAISFDSFFLELQQTWSGGPDASDSAILGPDGKCMVNEVHLYTVVATPAFVSGVSCYVFGYQMNQADPTDKYVGPQLQSTPSAQNIGITELKFTFPSGTLRQISNNDFTVGVSFNNNYIDSRPPNSQFREPTPEEPDTRPAPTRSDPMVPEAVLIPETVKQRQIRTNPETGVRRLAGVSLKKDVLFAPDSARLSAPMKRTLRQAARLARASDSRIAITGFAASSPRGTKFEKRIAEKRALRVANFLRQQGIENRIYFHGLSSRRGSEFPGQPRRVEIRVLK
jgi:outer membrane protein OmpA-like peptidoglycan-associated protein